MKISAFKNSHENPQCAVSGLKFHEVFFSPLLVFIYLFFVLFCLLMWRLDVFFCRWICYNKKKLLHITVNNNALCNKYLRVMQNINLHYTLLFVFANIIKFFGVSKSIEYNCFILVLVLFCLFILFFCILQ